MKKLALYCSAVTFLASSAFAQTPVIGAIAHAATYSPAGIPNSAIPQGGFFALFTLNAGPTTGVSSTGAFQTSLSNVSVSITSGGTTVPALLYFVYAGQINGVLPSSTPVGAATVTVTYNGAASAAFPFNVVSSNFGFFTENLGGSGPAIAQSYPSYTLNSLTATAKPGDTVIFYGTGLGPAVGNVDESSTGVAGGAGVNLITADNLDFHLYLGGVEATSGVIFAGRSQYVALDQIDFTIPSNAPSGCYVPVIIRIGSIVSNSASISINASNQTCSDPFGLTAAQISQATTGTLKVGSVLLTRLALLGILPGNIAITQDEAQAHFYDFSGNSVLTNGDFLSLSSYGSCQITNCSSTYTCVPSATGLPVTGLDAGTALSISGSGVPATSVPSVSPGFYDAKLGSSPLMLGSYPLLNFLQPGTFTFSGTGGSDVQAFSASITVPEFPNETIPTVNPFTWSSPQFSATNISVSRASDLTVNWTGASGYVLISVGSATNISTTTTANYNSATITCLQPASAGTYTIPSWLLSALPASSSVNLGALNAPGAAVLMGLYNPGTFTAPGLDVGIANSIVTSGQNVNLQ